MTQYETVSNTITKKTRAISFICFLFLRIDSLFFC